MLTLSKNLKIPTDYVTWKSAILGRTGSGKTNTAVVLAEQMIQRGYPLAILDPQGDWWGLRSKYSIAILGGEHGDIPLEPTAGELAADFVIGERIPVLLDLFTMGEAEMVRFAADFAKRLWTKNREALHVFLDEADLFAPQRDIKGPKAQCLGAWQNIVRRGRSRGIGCTMITQRSAVINKDLLTQADPLIVHRLTAPQDLAAVQAYLDVHGTSRDETRSILSSLAKLSPGEAYVISPGSLEIEPRRIAVRKRKSFDSSATPEAGKSVSGPRDFASVDLGALTSQFEATIERAKADDPKELRRQIAELQKQVKAAALEVDQATVDRAVAAAVAGRDKEWQRAIKERDGIITRLSGRMTKAAELLHVNGEATPALEVEQFSGVPETTVPRRSLDRKNTGASGGAVAKAKTASRPAATSTGDLPKGEAATLTALIQFPDGLRREQLTVLTGYKRSSRDAYIQRLREKGFVEKSGDAVLATAEGIQALPDAEPLPTGAELQEYWLNRLPEGERRVLEVLIDRYPDQIHRDEISEQTEYKRSSRDAYIQRLKAKQLVSVASGGLVEASETLF